MIQKPHQGAVAATNLENMENLENSGNLKNRQNIRENSGIFQLFVEKIRKTQEKCVICGIISIENVFERIFLSRVAQ